MNFKYKSLVALLALGLVGCGNSNTAVETKPETEIASNQEANEEIETIEEVADTTSDEQASESSVVADEIVANLGVLAGPTGAGAINLIEEGSIEDSPIQITPTIEGAPDAIVPKIVSGEVDLAVIPANLASTLYNKTEGKVKVLAINNLGVLYLVQNGEPTITSLDDLVNSGQTIYASGKGATPELAINQILTSAGYKPEEVNIEYVAEASELAQKMIAGEANVAIMPEPMVTNVLMKNENASVVLDLNELYEEAVGSPLISAVLVGRSEYLETSNVETLLDQYKQSIEKANTNVDETAALLGKYEVMPEPVAKKALPNLALKYIDGDEMEEMMQTFLGSLLAANPEMVGGKLPEDDFYYKK